MITIIGVGALGSHVALLLRNEKAGLKVVDFDRVEQKNTQAQFHTKMSLGRNKAQATAQTFQGLFGLKVEAVPHKLEDGNAEAVLNGSDLVIDCTDNIAARRVIQQACDNHGYHCLHGALSASGDFARIIWDHLFEGDEEGGEGATCIDGEHLPFFAAAASYLAIEAQRFVKTGSKRSFQLTPAGVIRLA